MAQPGPSKASLWKGKLAIATATAAYENDNNSFTGVSADARYLLGIPHASPAYTAVFVVALLFGASSKSMLLVVLCMYTP